jgi:hypothetical protein
MKKSIIWQIPLEEFKDIVAKSKSYREVLNAVGLHQPGNYSTLHKRLNAEKIDTSHFSPFNVDGLKLYNKGKKIPHEKLFSENSLHDRKTIKERIISEKLLPYKCSICGQEPFWNNKEMLLILDHKNGLFNDNRLENLRFVCPNCNIQLDTNCGKNKHKVTVNNIAE